MSRSTSRFGSISIALGSDGTPFCAACFIVAAGFFCRVLPAGMVASAAVGSDGTAVCVDCFNSAAFFVEFYQQVWEQQKHPQ